MTGLKGLEGTGSMRQRGRGTVKALHQGGGQRLRGSDTEREEEGKARVQSQGGLCYTKLSLSLSL
eukprot:633392-Rhodomonas_salina.2